MLSNIQKKVDPLQQWSNLNSIGLIESVRTVDGKTTAETRYYISSLTNELVKLLRCVFPEKEYRLSELIKAWARNLDGG